MIGFNYRRWSLSNPLSAVPGAGAQPGQDTGLLTALGNFAVHLFASRTAQRPRVVHAFPASLHSAGDPAGKHENHDERHP